MAVCILLKVKKHIVKILKDNNALVCLVLPLIALIAVAAFILILVWLVSSNIVMLAGLALIIVGGILLVRAPAKKVALIVVIAGIVLIILNSLGFI